VKCILSRDRFTDALAECSLLYTHDLEFYAQSADDKLFWGPLTRV